MRLMLKYFEESPADLFDPDRYRPTFSGRETRLWRVAGRPVAMRRADGLLDPLSDPSRGPVAGKEHHRYVIDGGPAAADFPRDRQMAEKSSNLSVVDSASFDKLVGELFGDAPCAVYLVCKPPSRILPELSPTPAKLLGKEADVEGREGLLARASIEHVRSVLRQSIRPAGLETAFCMNGGTLVQELAKGGLAAARSVFAPVTGEASDYLAFHRALAACDLILMPTGEKVWGRDLGVYSTSPRRAEVERALLMTGDEVYRVEDSFRFDFNLFPPPWDEPSVRCIKSR